MSQQQLSVFNGSQDTSLIINQNENLLFRGLTGPSEGNSFNASFFYYDSTVAQTVTIGRTFQYDSFVINNLGINITTGAGGTALLITVPGIYKFDYGTVGGANAAIGLFTAATQALVNGGNGTLIAESVCGSVTGTNWLAGSHVLNVTAPIAIGLCAVGGTVTTPVIISAKVVVRLQVQKIA